MVWRKYGGSIAPNHLVTNNFLELVRVTQEDAGMYVCHGTDEQGQNFKAHSEVKVGGKRQHQVFWIIRFAT